VDWILFGIRCDFWRLVGRASDEAIYHFAQPGPAHTLAQGRHLSRGLLVDLIGNRCQKKLTSRKTTKTDGPERSLRSPVLNMPRRH